MPGGFRRAPFIERLRGWLVEPACPLCELVVSKSSRLKLVEPACERQRVGRVETMVTLSGVLWSGLPFG
ncbi:hypothetical protein, partial [Arachnia propionica]